MQRRYRSKGAPSGGDLVSEHALEVRRGRGVGVRPGPVIVEVLLAGVTSWTRRL